MAILHHTEDNKYLFFCPACKCCHYFNSTWTWNSDWEKPTVSPSILVKSVDNPPEDPATGDFAKDADGKYLLENGRLKGAKDRVCHSYIKDGKIEFLSDCTHDLAGKTINLENF